MSDACDRVRTRIAEARDSAPRPLSDDTAITVPIGDLRTLVQQAEALRVAAPTAHQAIEIGPT